MDDFNRELASNSQLKKEFEAYKKITKFLNENDKALSDDLKCMKDFEFDPGIYLDILKYGGGKKPDKQKLRKPEKKDLKKKHK